MDQGGVICTVCYQTTNQVISRTCKWISPKLFFLNGYSLELSYVLIVMEKIFYFCSTDKMKDSTSTWCVNIVAAVVFYIFFF